MNPIQQFRSRESARADVVIAPVKQSNSHIRPQWNGSTKCSKYFSDYRMAVKQVEPAAKPAAKPMSKQTITGLCMPRYMQSTEQSRALRAIIQ